MTAFLFLVFSLVYLRLRLNLPIISAHAFIDIMACCNVEKPRCRLMWLQCGPLLLRAL
jgi:hypothetical protein